MRPDSSFCHNCGIRLTGPFCAACGQRAVPLDIRLHDFFHELVHEMVHVDGRIFQSILRLLMRPGFLTREYLQGRRVRWISPMRLYLVFSVVFFAISTMPARNPVRVSISRLTPEKGAELQQIGSGNMDELGETLRRRLLAWIPRVMFVLVPLFAGLTLLAYRKADANYLHHLYFALHVHAAWFAAGAMDEAAELVRPGAFADRVGMVMFVYGMAYLFVALRRIYRGSVLKTLAAMAFVLTVYGIAVASSVLAIVFPVVRRFMEMEP